MGFESFHQEKIVTPNTEGSKKESIDEGRRKFLKTLVKGAIVAAAVSAGCSPEKKEKKPLPEPKKEDKIQEKIFIEETQEEGYIDDDDIKTTREAIDFKNKEKIVIDRSVSEKTRREWERKYSRERVFIDSLNFAIREIEQYLTEFRRIFKEEGVPEELLFLAIPESHCKKDAVSQKEAKGYFQFTKDTGKKFGLIINDKIDERENPVKSARACAKYFKYLRKCCKGKSDDWSLELSGYNGGFIWKYLEGCYRSQKNPNYDGFMEYITNGLNDARKETKNNKFIIHEVRKGETLGKIAAIYKTNEETIRTYNNLKKKYPKKKKNIKGKEIKSKTKPEILQKGQKIRIPLIDKKGRSLFISREAAFKYKTAGYLENLVYPPKYIAVLKLVKKAKPQWFESNNLNNKK